MNFSPEDDLEEIEPDQSNPFFDWLAENYPKLSSADSSKHSDVVVEMGRLIELANSFFPDAETARAVIGWFVTTYGAEPEGEKAYLSLVAAQACLRYSYDASLRDEIYPLIRRALCECTSLRADIRLIMLDALEAFIHDRHWREDNAKELGDVLMSTLRMEFQRTRAERDERFQVRLLFLFRNAGGAEAAPLFDAIADAHENPEIRELAKQTSRYVMYSLERIWNSTREDQVSGSENRAIRLQEAREMGYTQGEMVQAIFNEMKGMPILSGDDARAQALSVYMSADEPARTQLAAAFAIAMCLRVNEVFPTAADAIHKLAYFAVNCDTASDINDALLAMKRACENSPCLLEVAVAAKQRASEEFIRRSQLDFRP